MATQHSRIKIKRSTVASQLPTIPASNDHTDGTWIATDIYKGEIFINIADGRAWFRDDSGLIEIGKISDLSSYVPLAGTSSPITGTLVFDDTLTDNFLSNGTGLLVQFGAFTANQLQITTDNGGRTQAHFNLSETAAALGYNSSRYIYIDNTDIVITTNGLNAAKLRTSNLSGAVVYEFPQKSGAQTFAMVSDLASYIASSEKGAANGVVPLNGSTLIDSAYLPSYVDDVLEYADFASFPGTGETDKIYVALDNNKLYRWSGATYIEVSSDVMETVTTIGALINSATSKTTPVDADQIGLMDSAASNILKKLSWANVKASLKTYFDTLYPSGNWTKVKEENFTDGWSNFDTGVFFSFINGDGTTTYNGSSSRLEFDLGTTNNNNGGFGLNVGRYSEVRISATFQIGDGGGADSEGFVYFKVATSSPVNEYQFRIAVTPADHGQTNEIELRRVDAGTPTTIGSYSTTITTNTTHDIEFYRDGNDLVCVYDSTEIIRVSDTTYMNGYKPSFIAAGKSTDNLFVSLNKFEILNKLQGV